MTKFRNSLILAAASALLLLPGSAAAETNVNSKLVEQNGSGVSGTVSLTALDSGELKVVIRSQGMVPGQPHAQHVHGAMGGKHFACPTSEEHDTDGDGILTNEEATGEYGAVFMALTTSGGVTPQDGLDAKRMPVADSEGRLSYERTFSAEQIPEGLLDHLSALHVVQHGIDVNNNDKYDVDALGVSTFAENLGASGVPEEATNPASCSVVEAGGMAGRPRGGLETGGAAPDLNTPLAVAGVALLLLSVAFAVSAARSRRQHSADAGQGSSS